MREQNWKELIGKVVLVRPSISYNFGNISEARVISVSASGDYVQLGFKRSNDIGYNLERWEEKDSYIILEVLY